MDADGSAGVFCFCCSVGKRKPISLLYLLLWLVLVRNFTKFRRFILSSLNIVSCDELMMMMMMMMMRCWLLGDGLLLQPWQIALIVVGGVLLIAAIVILIVLCKLKCCCFTCFECSCLNCCCCSDDSMSLCRLSCFRTFLYLLLYFHTYIFSK